jgi:membrane-bound ClpP family serine protease
MQGWFCAGQNGYNRDSMEIALAYLLIAVGLLFLAAEVFFPSGILSVLAVCAIVGGVTVAFIHDPYHGWFSLILVFVAVPVLLSAILHFLPRSRLGQRFFVGGSEEDATVASMPVNLELEQLRGKIGRTLSALRPAGVVDFEGRRIDTLTEGMMVEPGQWVRCIDVRAGKVIVRPVDKIDPEGLETAIYR